MNEDMPQGKKTVADEQIIEFITRLDEPFVFASEVAEEFDHSRQWAHERLETLKEQGAVQKKSGGVSSVIWYL